MVANTWTIFNYNLCNPVHNNYMQISKLHSNSPMMHTVWTMLIKGICKNYEYKWKERFLNV